jgi:polysaccharide export outer membrane protein
VPVASKPLPYCLVPVTPAVVDVVAANRERLAGRFVDRQGPVAVQIGTGDLVSVTLFESAAGGLFFPIEGGLRNGNFLTIPPQLVDEKGDITIPYAGAIKARGRTAEQIQAAIVDALKDRALEPQAIVTVTERHYAMVSVLGEVNTPVRFPANLSGERVLDAIARAGGIKSQGQDTWVMVQRDHKVAVAPFEALAYEPANNIFIQPLDVIYVYKEPQTFLAFGAVGASSTTGSIAISTSTGGFEGTSTTTGQAQFPFGSWRLSLAEALAKASGLLDERADPSWVFLYRAERQHVAKALGLACAVTDGPYVPVIYEVNLRDPAAMFLATQFPMRNKDVIYVANAHAVETTKFMNHLRLMNATIQDPINTAIAAFALQTAIKGTTTSAVLVGGTGAVP